MTLINSEEINNFMNNQMIEMQNQRISSLIKLNLSDLLQNSPDFIELARFFSISTLVDRRLSTVEANYDKKYLADFLRNLAIFVAERTKRGHKSNMPGVDLEFVSEGKHYLVSVKSGTNWGNSSQHSQLKRDLSLAVSRLKQSSHNILPVAVLGICYGKTKTTNSQGYLKVVGQNFWYLISGSKSLYTDIIEPLGFRAKDHNEIYNDERAKTVNLLTNQFFTNYCDPESGAINWEKVVEANSGNFDLDKFLIS